MNKTATKQNELFKPRMRFLDADYDLIKKYDNH